VRIILILKRLKEQACSIGIKTSMVYLLVNSRLEETRSFALTEVTCGVVYIYISINTNLKTIIRKKMSSQRGCEI